MPQLAAGAAGSRCDAATRREALSCRSVCFSNTQFQPRQNVMAALPDLAREALGIDHFMMRCHWPGLEFEKSLASIRRLGEIFA